MKLRIALLALSLLANTAIAATSEFLSVLDKKESGNNTNIADHLDTNGKTVKGVDQIQYSYWLDAISFDPSIGGTWNDCHNKEYSHKIVIAYMSRYCPNALENDNWEILSRTHNGGPAGSKHGSTLKYWNGFKKIARKMGFKP